MSATQIPEGRLIELRRAGREQISQFVDPRIISACCSVLDRRGEQWAETVLGRTLDERSLAVSHRPKLRDGEPYTLVMADRDEDLYVAESIWNSLGDNDIT